MCVQYVCWGKCMCFSHSSQSKTPHDLAVENKNAYDADLILMARQKTDPQGIKEYLTRQPVSAS